MSSILGYKDALPYRDSTFIASGKVNQVSNAILVKQTSKGSALKKIEGLVGAKNKRSEMRSDIGF